MLGTHPTCMYAHPPPSFVWFISSAPASSSCCNTRWHSRPSEVDLPIIRDHSKATINNILHGTIPTPIHILAKWIRLDIRIHGIRMHVCSNKKERGPGDVDDICYWNRQWSREKNINFVRDPSSTVVKSTFIVIVVIKIVVVVVVVVVVVPCWFQRNLEGGL